MIVDLVAGARPNFMKVAPLHRALVDVPGCDVAFVHAGQHYDAAMSDVFVDELGLPAPDAFLEVGSGSHGEQTARGLVAYEARCRERRPDWVVVVGDVNTTMACALAATKLGVRVAHLEAGLRSGDRSMPEEVNRVVTDAVADLLWTPSADADANLRREGVRGKVELVGNVMIDSLVHLRDRIYALDPAAALGIEGPYGAVTVHRPASVDEPAALARTVDALVRASHELPLVFPVHPRTRERLAKAGVPDDLGAGGRIRVVPPMGYIEFLALVRRSAIVVTDSGGVQEETTFLGVPCATVRDTTERPITISEGTNRLVAWDDLPSAIADALGSRWRMAGPPPLWDGNAAARAAASLLLAHDG